MSTFLPTLTETETQGTGTQTPKPQATTSALELTEPPSTGPNENSVAATEKPEAALPSPMSVERIQFYQRDVISTRDGCRLVASA